MENNCIVCGVVIPEGRQVCPNCENDIKENRFTRIERAQSLASKSIIKMQERAKKEVEQARKETAREILKPLYDACKDDSYGQVVVDFAILEDFARKHGVDLGE